MMKFVDPGRMGHVDKNDWCAVNEASGRNRSRKSVLHWSVRASRAHAALLIRDGFLFCWFLLGKRGIQKKSGTNGLHCSGAREAPRLTGSRGWHQAPAQSCYPRSIFAQSRRAGLTDGRNIKNSGGEGGIRTPGRGFSPYNGLANRPIKPLWHLSSNVSNTLAQFSSWLGALLVHYNSENVAATKRQRE